MPNIFLMGAMRLSLGCTPSQTAPRPKAVAASRRFSAAAEQSCTQEPGEIVVSPHTAIQSGASNNILPYGWPLARLSSINRSVTTTKCHGFRSEDEGAAIAASSSVLVSFSLIGLSVYLRMLRRANIVFISSFVTGQSSRTVSSNPS